MNILPDQQSFRGNSPDFPKKSEKMVHHHLRIGTIFKTKLIFTKVLEKLIL